jgi:hypothetical protein
MNSKQPNDITITIAPGKVIQFQSLEDCLLFAAFTPHDAFKAIYSQAMGIPVEDISTDIQKAMITKENFKRYKALVYRTNLTDGTPLWKAMKRGMR